MGFRSTPKETGFGVGERGFEKGCEIPVEMEELCVDVRGVSVEGERREGKLLNLRQTVEVDCSADARRRQERQIILMCCGRGEKIWL